MLNDRKIDPAVPIVLGGAVLTLLTVAIVSACVPTRRTAVDPMVALRCD